MDKGLSKMEEIALSPQLISEDAFNRRKLKVLRKEEPMAKKKKVKKKKKKNK